MSTIAPTPTATPGPAALATWQRAVLFGAAFFICAEAGRYLSVRDSTYVSFWLPAGLYVAVLLLNERRAWPWLVLAAFAANLTFDLLHGTSFLVALLFGATNAIQSATGASLVRRFVAERPTLTTLKELLGFLGLAAVLGSAVGATLGSATLTVFGLTASFLRSWQVWWGSNAMSILLVSPLILTGRSMARVDYRRFARPRGLLEAAFLVLLLAALAGYELFMNQGIMSPDKGWLLIPLLWAGLRFGPFGAAAVNLLLAVLFAFFTTQFFAGLTPAQVAAGEYVFVMEISLVLMSVLSLTPAIVLHERNQRLRELRASEARYRRLFDHSTDAVLLVGTDGAIVEANPAARRMFGYTEDELKRIGRSGIADAGDARLQRLLDERAKTGSARGETTYIRKDGSRFIGDTASQVFRDAQGGEASSVIVRDVTEQRRAEELLRATLDYTPDVAVQWFDRAGRVLYWNSASERFYGVRADEAVGRTMDELIHTPEQHGEFLGLIAGVERTGKAFGPREIAIRGPHGATVTVICTLFAIPGQNAKPIFVSMDVDISERKRAEEELQRSLVRLRELSRRLVEVEEADRRRFSRELHDRVGQNLAALSLNLETIRGELSEQSRQAVAARLDDTRNLVRATVEHVRDVIAELRPQVLDDYGLVAALRGSAADFARRVGVPAAVTGQDPTPRLPPGVETELFRIAQEALNNVAKHARATKVDIVLEEADGRLILTVADDGIGFDVADQSHSQGHWGVTMMRERAAALAAALRVDSAPGRGTRVEVAVAKAAR